jgi:hypothetical protein
MRMAVGNRIGGFQHAPVEGQADRLENDLNLNPIATFYPKAAVAVPCFLNCTGFGEKFSPS